MNNKNKIKPSSETKDHHGLARLNRWVITHQRAGRLSSLVIGLVICLILLPPYLRAAFWYSLQDHKILASMLLVFSLLALSLVWSTGQKFDTWAFLFFNVWRPRPVWLDRVMFGFTQIGSIIATLVIALVLFLTSDPQLAYELILGTLSLWAVVEMVKFVVHRSRPFVRLTQARVVGYRARGRSFPSGHTSQSFFIATLVVQNFHASAWLAILLYSMALLVGVTRMYVGAHYPRDVLAGAILGTAWGMLGALI